jgi:hypothetical protein
LEYAVLTCRALLGLVFVASTLSKIHSRAAFDEFVKSLRRLKIVPNGAVAAMPIVAVEAAVPLALAFPATVTAGFLLAAAVLIIFIGAVSLVLHRGNSVPCPCFGPSRAPLGTRHIARNVLLLGAACVGAVGTLFSPLGHLQSAGVAISIFSAVILAALVIRLDDLIDLFAYQ